MAHVHTASFPSTGQRVAGTAGCSGGSVSAASDKFLQRCTWAARSAASWLRVVADGGAHQRRGRPAGRHRRRGERATRSATAPSSSAAGTTSVGQPDRPGLRRAHRAAGQADLQRPRVADQLHEGARAGQVGHQAERRLGQAQLGVVGEDPQVAGERELRAGADGVALHRGDRDDPRRPQPAEAGLEAADPLLGLLGGEPAQVTQTARPRPGRR